MENNKTLCLASTLVIALLIYIYFVQPMKESYSDYHVDYPKDFYPQIFPEKQNHFLQKIPYDDTLSTRHFRKRYYNRITPECRLKKSCPPSPGGYFKTHLNYHEDRPKLKHDFLGYSVEGIPYADYQFNHPKQPTPLSTYLSNRIPDVKEPEFPDDYPEWFEYSPEKSAKYYGFPYGGKIHH